MKRNRLKDWNALLLILGAESISMLGTSMTRFALMVWAFDQTQSATALALLGFFSCLTFVAFSPLAGVLVDRLDRRRVMVLADLGAGAMTALLLGLHAAGRLEFWHIYLAVAVSGACEAFQSPAFSASVSLLSPPERYTRANALYGLGRAVASMLAPAFAGMLLPLTGLNAIMTIDLLTMTAAIISLGWIDFPRPTVSAVGQQAGKGWANELRFGVVYLRQHAGLRGIVSIHFLINLFATLTYFSVLSPMILARSGGDEGALSLVRTVMGLGGILGGLFVSRLSLRGAKTRVYLFSTMISFLVCDFLTATSRGVWGWGLAGFLSELTIPLITSPYYSLWQEHVPPDVQGRVFSIREMIQVSSQPIGYLLGGLLADRVFEPALQPGGALVGLLGGLIGTGPGAGMASMFLMTSILGSLTGVLGLFSASIRALDRAPQAGAPSEGGDAELALEH
jgi:MFS family permease